jgi:hypothetical protein
VLAVLRMFLLSRILFDLFNFGLFIVDFLISLNEVICYFVYTRVGYPFVHTPIDAFIMDVVFVGGLNLLLSGIVVYNKLKKSNKEEKSMKIFSIW